MFAGHEAFQLRRLLLRGREEQGSGGAAPQLLRQDHGDQPPAGQQLRAQGYYGREIMFSVDSILISTFNIVAGYVSFIHIIKACCMYQNIMIM